MASKPTQRTMAELKKMGFAAQIVERWNSFAKCRVDLFGCIDIVAVRYGVGVLGIQTTDATSHSKRRDKSIAEPRLRQWILAGGRFEIWSWGKRGDRGKRKLWTLRREEVTADMLTSDVNGTDGTECEDAGREGSREVSISVANLNMQDAVASLVSRLCPHCGKDKVVRQTLCHACYLKLPHAMRAELENSVDAAYVKAIQAAFAEFGTDLFVLPAQDIRAAELPVETPNPSRLSPTIGAAVLTTRKETV